MFGIGKLLRKEQRFRLIKIKAIQKLVIWKNRNKHPYPEYSLILFTRMFDADWYLTEYPDVAVTKADPIQHYIEHGIYEKRNPSPWFSTKKYADMHSLKESENPFLHFLLNEEELETVDNYKVWRELYFSLSDDRLREIDREIGAMKIKPLISVIIPIYNPNLTFLRKALDSVKNQLYGNWEVYLADAVSTEDHVVEFLREINSEEKIKVVFGEESGQTSEVTNSAIETAKGDYIAFLGHNNELCEDAFYEVVKALNAYPHMALIYSDEDKISDKGELFDPHFKSDWNPLLFYSRNYINHFAVVKSGISKKIGGLRKDFEGSEGYDFLLRYLEQISETKIHHIQKVLYHCRAVEKSSLDLEGKDFSVEVGKKALESHLLKRFPEAEVELTNKVFYKVNFPVPDNPPLVSIIILIRENVEHLEKCLESVFSKTTYLNYEIILLDSNSTHPEVLEYLKKLEGNPKVTILKNHEVTNFSAINNYAAKQVNGEIILFLNQSVEVITANWLSEMVSYFTLDDVAAVGAKLLFEDDTIQHAGIILGIGGVAGYPHKNFPSKAMGYMCRANLVQNVSAVTAKCIAVRKEIFEEVEGFDENLKAAFIDVDLCIKIRERGDKIVFTPHAQLYHYESKNLESSNQSHLHSDTRYMQKKWRGILYCDPYYNPNLSLGSENFQLAFPPVHIYGDLREA